MVVLIVFGPSCFVAQRRGHFVPAPHKVYISAAPAHVFVALGANLNTLAHVAAGVASLDAALRSVGVNRIE